MGRLLLVVVLVGLGLWALRASARGPGGIDLAQQRAEEAPQRVTYIPIVPYVPRSNRTGSTRGPRVGGGGPSSGK